MVSAELTKGTMGLTSYSKEAFFQKLRYRHKERQNTEANFKESKL